LRLLCGLIDPTEGSAQVAGFDSAHQSQTVKDHIGYMAQRFGLYQDLSVQENMDFYADLFGIVGAERTKLSADLLRMTRMEPFRQRPAGKLSGIARKSCFSTNRPTAWIRFRAAISGPSSINCCRTASRF
jgi:ABC-2 type transport system ATP-binding protein